jgi:cytoskeleton protein RodZ
MSEEQQGDAFAAGPSAGAMLRQAREAAGLHVATLAVSLKVPVRKLEALEDDRYDQLGDAVFVRALASSVCRTLKVDPQPVLERLPQGSKPRLVQTGEGINAPFRAPGDGPRPGWMDQLSRPVALAVIALLTGALVLIFMPNLRQDDAKPAAKAEDVPPPVPQQVVETRPEPSAPVAVAPSPAPAAAPVQAPAAAPAPAPAPVQAAAPAPVAPATTTTLAAAAKPASAPAAAPARVASAAAPAASATASPAAPAAPATGIVVFRTKAPSWISVTDAKGNAVLRRTLESGETVGATGALPLNVTVGSVEATEVQVRGKPYDLGPVSRDNVARFEIK